MLVAFVLAATAAAPVESGRVLKWGCDAQGGAPYVFQDPMDPNHLVGFEVDLANAVAGRLGARAVPVQGQWDRLLELLARGDFDVALNGVEQAEEKKRVALLTAPYFAAPEVLTVRRGDAAAPRTMEALRGRRVGTLPGSLASRILERAGAEVRTYDGGQNEIYEDLRLGRTDAVLLDDPIAHFYGDLEESLERVPGDFGEVRYVMAVHQGNEALLGELNEALAALAKDGTLRDLYQRWGLWNGATARLIGADPAATAIPTEYERWRASVGKLPPLWERIRQRYPQTLPLFARAAGMTLALSLVSMLLAIAVGVMTATGRRYGPAPVRVLAAGYVEFFRGTPLLIQLTMVYFGLPELGIRLDPFVAGCIALGLNYGAAEAENYRAGLESVPAGQSEASAVLGLSRWQALRYVIGPQAARISLPPMTNDFIALLKDSSLVSLVTLTELTKTYVNLGNAMRDHLGLGVMVALWYLAIGLPFAFLSKRLEGRLGRHLRRSEA
ncbi:MAG TPA: ABC transporter substrate-binding protein/permease [Myxococcaceae bacterium]|nr:ABC transporter substrate-binding protein/permease [Myxococcaceae bacterium]